MTTLRRVIVVGLLEGNPTPPALAEDRDAVDPNGGWKSATSDNAALWGHPIDDSGYTAVEYGAMVTRWRPRCSSMRGGRTSGSASPGYVKRLRHSSRSLDTQRFCSTDMSGNVRSG